MIAEKVRTVVSEYAGQEVDFSTSLEIGLGFSPYDVLDMVIQLEGEFPIMIPDSDTQRWATVKDIADYVERILEKQKNADIPSI